MKTFIAMLMLAAFPLVAQPVKTHSVTNPAGSNSWTMSSSGRTMANTEGGKVRTKTRVKMTAHGRRVVTSHHANHSMNH